MKIIHLFLKSIATLLLSLVVLLSSFYLFSPVYDFQEPEPFTGDSFYNPYAGTVDSLWRKGNFHAHTSAWGGVTNGQNSIVETEQAYQMLNYDIHPLSNYQSHTAEQRSNDGEPLLFPLYEQGWGIAKFHFLVFGNYPIQWRNFLFFTTLSHKQALIKQMGEHADLICLNHLEHVRGMASEDMKYLSGYSVIEAVSGMANSLSFWDSALSSGRLVYGIANDDSHGVSSVGRFATIFNASSTDYSNVVASLSSGRSYSLAYPDSMMGNFTNKQIVHALYPRLQAVKIESDTLRITFDHPVRIALFIGQNGDTLAVDSLKTTVSYRPTSEDNYVRTQLVFDNGIRAFLNPIVRTDDGLAPDAVSCALPSINWGLTILYNLVVAATLLGLGYLIVRIWKRKKSRLVKQKYTTRRRSCLE